MSKKGSATAAGLTCLGPRQQVVADSNHGNHSKGRRFLAA
jgi:hypothetical protein